MRLVFEKRAGNPHPLFKLQVSRSNWKEKRTPSSSSPLSASGVRLTGGGVRSHQEVEEEVGEEEEVSGVRWRLAGRRRGKCVSLHQN